MPTRQGGVVEVFFGQEHLMGEKGGDINKLWFFVVPSLFILFLAWFLWTFVGQFLYVYIRDRDRWKERTIPISADVQSDICEKFAIENARLCSVGNPVYGPELFPPIREFFGIRQWYSDATREVTRDEIEEKLGVYFVDCEDPILLADGTNYYRCIYDLVGDGEYPIAVVYHIDNTVMKMFNSTDP